METQCCISGGGPAGMMLGYLMARTGVKTVVLEKHGDFLRDFRGDTVHPSTMQIMADLELLDEFLKLPHSKVEKLGAEVGDTSIQIADFTHLDTPCPYIAFMPQWDFLNFLAEKGKELPSFEVIMEAKVTGLLSKNGRVHGVTAETTEGLLEIEATLTVGADGRTSNVRDAANMQVHDIGSAIDVLWFRVSRGEGFKHVLGHMRNEKFVITIDRNEYWQCAYVIHKGGIEEIKAQGIEAFRKNVVETAPELKGSIEDVKSWDDVKLLTVGINMLEEWSKPGVLCIGDAAHTMSPVGGVGINLAVQDAVATANLLAAKLKQGTLTDDDVKQVQKRRQWPASVVQKVQVFIQHNVLEKAIGEGINKPPLPLRLATHLPWVQRKVAGFIGLGVRPERVKI